MNLKQYNQEYAHSVNDTQEFWKEKATDIISWSKPFNVVHNSRFGSDEWFSDGELNACYNCVDRWAQTCPEKTAIIFDSNEGETVEFTYKQVLEQVCQISNHLKSLKKGDSVTIYLPMGPEAVFAALACARLGLPHSAVFGGFSPESLRLRIKDSNSKLLITQDFSMRGEKKIDFIGNVAQAVIGIDTEIRVIVFDKHRSVVEEHYNIRNLMIWSEMVHSSEYVPCTIVNSEHPLFYLYTSGSTGMPKGLIHSTGGYLTYAAYTLKTAFDIQEEDRFCCTADIGWITGHSYCIYGPLCLGITTVILEGLPTHPTPYRYFDIVQRYKLTQLYTAPTAIRLLKKHFETHVLDLSSYNLTSLRCLGSVGEPINEEAYKFFSKSFGNLHIVDTYWQTETGGFLIAPIMGVKTAKPESASLPMPGIIPVITNDLTSTKRELCAINELGRIYIARSWPGIARGILNNRKRYLSSYFSTDIYFTGDEGIRDADGDFWIRGRADDVINVSGHRISTAEIESAACTDNHVAEAAVIAVNHEIKGQSMVLFVVLKSDETEFENSIKNTICARLGGFCRPERVVKCAGIPKTATGKIMRRILRSLVMNHELGDLSTCINVECIENIKSSLGNKSI